MSDTSTTATDSMTTTIDTHLEAYGESEPARRQRLIAASWAPEGHLFDPPIDGQGHDGIDAMFAAVQGQFPGHTFRRTTAVGCPVRRVDVAIERVGRGGDEPAQHITHGQARHGRHRPGHVGRRAPREQPADTLPGSEPDLPVVAADLSADNHATNLAIGWLAGQLRPGALLVSLFYYTEVI